MGASAVVVAVVVVKRHQAAKEAAEEEARLKQKWASVPEGTAVLHQYPRTLTCPTPSPFVLKLETYLRMAKIPYVVDHTQPAGPLGKCPWITFNGKDMGDSQLIIEFLSDKLGTNMDSKLTKEQRAISHSVRLMVESHWYYCFILDRYIYSGQDFGKWLYLPIPPAIFRKALEGYKGYVKRVCDTIGFTRFGQRQVDRFGVEDLQAVSTLLGDKPFLHGEEPTSIDCTIFGMTTMIIYASPDESPYKVALERDMRNLVGHNDRIKDRFFPDWEELKIKKE